MWTKSKLTVAALALVALGCEDAMGPEAVREPSFAQVGEDDLIAFSSDRDGRHEIYVMSPGGSGLMSLSNDPTTEDFEPTISPDGRWVAWVKQDFGSRDIWVTRSDGSGGTFQLTGSTRDEFEPAWSPKGDVIAFASTRGAASGYTMIYTVPWRRGAWTDVTGDRRSRSPAWSPDAKTLAYVSHKFGTADIFTMDLSAPSILGFPAPARAVVVNPSDDRDPAWSPDGRRIAFASNRTTDFDIHWVRPSGGIVSSLTNHPGRDTEPVYSPDGSQIAFVSDRIDFFGNLYQMTANGLSEAPMPNQIGGEVLDFNPDWR